MSIRFKSLQEAIDKLPEFFQPENAEGIDAVIQLEFFGDDGGNWYLTVKDNALNVSEGNSDNPTMTITAAAEDWLKVANNEASPMSLLMQGKIKLQGDMGLAMKFQNMFSMS